MFVDREQVEELVCGHGGETGVVGADHRVGDVHLELLQAVQTRAIRDVQFYSYVKTLLYVNK